jgi:hypothetical protein
MDPKGDWWRTFPKRRHVQEMTAMIEQIPLGLEGREYVLGQLRAGHTLAQCLIEQWPGCRHAHTLLPHGSGTESLTDFASGGKLSAASVFFFGDEVYH